MSAAAAPLPVTADRLRAALRGAGSDAPDLGDHVLNPELAELLSGIPRREAAVLVPIVERPGTLNVLLTTRAATLRQHSGQIAFPGGGVDPTDASPEAAALREAREEIGLDPALVSPIGRLPRYATTTGFRITPVAALVDPGFRLVLNPAEVFDCFEVPLAFLMDAANHRRDSRPWEGRERFFYVMPFGDRRIWGVTAGILRSLYEILFP